MSHPFLSQLTEQQSTLEKAYGDTSPQVVHRMITERGHFFIFSTASHTFEILPVTVAFCQRANTLLEFLASKMFIILVFELKKFQNYPEEITYFENQLPNTKDALSEGLNHIEWSPEIESQYQFEITVVSGITRFLKILVVLNKLVVNADKENIFEIDMILDRTPL